MNKKLFPALLGAAVAVIGGVSVVEFRANRSDVAESSVAAGAPLLPGLVDRINDVTSLEVVQNGGVLTIVRNGDTWELAEKGNFPVPFAKVREAAVGLSQLRILEEKTSRPERYEAIGVQEPGPSPEGAEPAMGGPSKLTLKDAQGGILASVIIGNTRPGLDPSVFVRRVGDAQSYLAEGAMDLPTGAAGWLDPKLLEIPATRVRSVAVHHPGGEVLAIEKDTADATSFTVRDVPPGKELKSPTAGDPLGAAIGYLSFEDVAPTSSIDFSGADAGVTVGPVVEYRTFDGIALTMQTAVKDGKTWVMLAPGFDASAFPEPQPGAEAPVKPGLKSKDEAQTEVHNLTALTSRWVFQIPEYKATVLKSTMADLLKESPPAAPPTMEGTQTIPLDLSTPPVQPPAAPPAQPQG